MHSRLGPHFDEHSGQSGRSVHTRLGPQEDPPTKYLTSPTLLSKPEAADDLCIYMAISESIINSTLIQEELGARSPVFYNSKDLLDAETKYPKIKNLILTLVVATRKLKLYIQRTHS